jgi:hypothetical protein
MMLRGIDVPLHLTQGNWTISELAIGVKDRVAGILPALISQAGGTLPTVFDKPVMIGIAVGVDPLQRRDDIRP